jgi:hypothetical protein
MPVILNRQQNTAGASTKAEWRPSAHASASTVWILAATRMRQTESTGMSSYLFWPGFHIRMNVYVEANENSRKKLQPLSKRNEFICLGLRAIAVSVSIMRETLLRAFVSVNSPTR